jgi:hypothetical protein
MKRAIFSLFLLASSSSFAVNYAICLLDKAPGLQNAAAAQAAINLCMKEHHGGIATVDQGSGRGGCLTRVALNAL